MAEKFAEVIAAPEKPNVPTRGIQDLATAGRRLGQLGNENASAIREGSRALAAGFQAVDVGATQLGRTLEQHDTTQDISHGYATINQLSNNLAQMQKTFLQSADPNDLTAPDRFQEEVVQPAIEQWQSGFQTKGGQRWAAEHGGALGEHYNNQFNQERATRAGQAVEQNINTGNDQAMQAVLADPAQLPIMLDRVSSFHQAIAAANPDLTSKQTTHLQTTEVQRVQRELTIAGVKGLIDKNPGADPNTVMAPYINRGLLTPTDVKSLTGYHQLARASAATDAAAKEQSDKDAAAAMSNTATGQAAQAILSPTQPPNIGRAILDSPHMDNEAKTTALSAHLTVTRGQDAPVSNPQNLDNLVSSLTQAKDPHTQVLAAVANGTLSKEDAAALSGMDQGQLQALSGVLLTGRNTILQPDPGSGVTNPARIASYARFQSAAIKGQLGDNDFDTGFSRFLPTHEDALNGTAPVISGERQPLHQILWGK